MELPLPVGLALVLCEHSDRSASENLNLHGLLNRVEGETFPLLLPRLCVYVALTDIRPRCQCKLDVVDGKTDKVILSGIEFEVPQVQQAMGVGVFEVTIDFSPFPIASPGIVLVRLFANGHLLLQRSITAEKTNPHGRSNTPH